MTEPKGTEQVFLPLLPLRGVLSFPGMVQKLDAGRAKSIASIEAAAAGDQHILLVMQRDLEQDDPGLADLYSVGTVACIKQVVRMPDDTVRILVEGEYRAHLLDVIDEGELLRAHCRAFPEPTLSAKHHLKVEALMRALKRVFNEFSQENPGYSTEFIQAVLSEENPATLTDRIAANALTNPSERQQILETRDPVLRMQDVTGMLVKEAQLMKLEKQIFEKVHERIDQHQKEYFLTEQLTAIHEELGDDYAAEQDELQERFERSAIEGEAREKVARELKRFSRMPSNQPDASVSRSYIEWMLDLPWGKTTADRIDVAGARAILDRGHFGLQKVKDRIIEYLAVAAMKGALRGPILCLVGPPGVGKTSIARAVAEALNRKFVRMSLGGLRDEAEIRGHRRTYVGAIPGRIIAGLRSCGSMNPVFLLDEIDKMASDFRGDPAASLLEALDPEQNKSFTDHYLEAPFDLSQVFFMTTANSTEGIPAPLLDRMELIEVSGYTLEEKVEIAKRHLYPKQLQENGLKRSQVRIGERGLTELIDGYTRESGVRNLERSLGSLCRKAAVSLSAPNAKASITLTPQLIEKYLGAPRYTHDPIAKQPETGVVNGLAWTPYGGETLKVEVAVMPGKGGLDLTGQLGDVMQESARAAYAYIRSRSDALGIPQDFHEKHDLHVHVPEGATPKDGPSAGVALTCAMVSAITGKKARQDIAMTGEITLLGKVLPIGGVKEKLLAAHRMGIDTVLLPGENRRDLDELPKNIRDALHVNLIGQVDQALNCVLMH